MNQIDKFTMFEYCFQQLTTRPFKDSDYIQITCKNNKDDIIKAIENDDAEVINRYSPKANPDSILDYFENGLIEYRKKYKNWKGILPSKLVKDHDAKMNLSNDIIKGTEKLLKYNGFSIEAIELYTTSLTSKELLTYIRDTYLINEYEESDISKDTSDESVNLTYADIPCLKEWDEIISLLDKAQQIV